MAKFENISIILSNSQMGENIGAVARVMKNFNLENLRLISPRDGWPNQKAIDTSSHAKDIINNAQIFNSTADALAGLNLVYATTARSRDMNKKAVTANQLALEIKDYQNSQNIGIMFGAERTGLENSEISYANKIVYIPTGKQYSSLNLSHSVGVIAYEIFQSLSKNKGDKFASKEISKLADKKDYNALYNFLETELDKANFFQVTEKKPKMMDNIRNIFSRAELSEQELRTLRGIFRAIKNNSI